MSNDLTVDLDAIKHLSYEKRFAIEIVEEIRQASGRNEKVEILKRAAVNKGFVKGLELAYNPRINFYQKKIPEYTPPRASAYHLEKVLGMLKSLYQREVTGHAAVDQLKNILEWSDAKDAKFIELIIARDLSCGIGISSINSVFPGMIPEYKVQLCDPFDRETLENFKFPAFIQTKEDGMRANLHFDRSVGSVSIYLRSGENVDLVPPQLEDAVTNHLSGQVPFSSMSFVLDGELLVSDGSDGYLSRKQGNGILNKLQKGTISENEISLVRFVCWDFCDLSAFWAGRYDVSYRARLEALTSAIEASGISNVIVPSSTKTVNSWQEANEFYKEQLSKNLEGAILKEMHSFWESGRQKWQMKMKAVLEDDFLITGVYEGKPGTRLVGKLGGFTYQSLDGTVTGRVGSGFSDKQRKDYFENPPVGQMATLEFNEYIESKDSEGKSLYLPVFIEVRSDTLNPLT